MIREKPNTVEVVHVGEVVSKKFSISTDPKMYGILSAGLYSNKMLAPIRELITNAYDANVEVGRDPYDFDVTMPTKDNPEFSVRDRGLGMTPEEIENLYSVYGLSSKEATNEQVGCLGLGSKSPFAYTDTFTIDSTKNGIRSVYHCWVEDGCPTLSKMLSEPAKDPSDTGTTVAFLVAKDDIDKFFREVCDLLMFWRKRPNVIGTTVQYCGSDYSITTLAEVWKKQEGELIVDVDDMYRVYKRCMVNGAHSNLIVAMGNIPYLIMGEDIGYKAYNIIPKELYWALYGRLYVVIDAPIGDLTITVSREKYEDTDNNRKKLRELIESAYKAVQEAMIEEYNSIPYDAYVEKLVWEKRNNALHMPEPHTKIQEDLHRCRASLRYVASSDKPYTIYGQKVIVRRARGNREIKLVARIRDARSDIIPDMINMCVFYFPSTTGYRKGLEALLLARCESLHHKLPDVIVIHDKEMKDYVETCGIEVEVLEKDKRKPPTRKPPGTVYELDTSGYCGIRGTKLTKTAWRTLDINMTQPAIKKHYVKLKGFEPQVRAECDINWAFLVTMYAPKSILRAWGIDIIYGIRADMLSEVQSDPLWVPFEDAIDEWLKIPAVIDKFRYDEMKHLYQYAEEIPFIEAYEVDPKVKRLMDDMRHAAKETSKNSAGNCTNLPFSGAYSENELVPHDITNVTEPAIKARGIVTAKYAKVNEFRALIEEVERKAPLLRLARNAIESREYFSYGLVDKEDVYKVGNTSWDNAPLNIRASSNDKATRLRKEWVATAKGYISMAMKQSKDKKVNE